MHNRVNAIGIKMPRVNAEQCFLANQRQAGVNFATVIAACAQFYSRAVLLFAAASENLNYTTNRFGTVQAGAWSTYNFNALYLAQGNMLQCSAASGSGIEFDPVHQHQYVIRVGAAHK